MTGYKFLLMVLGSCPSNTHERVLSFGGYIQMNASAHNEENHYQEGTNHAPPSTPR